MASNFVIAHRHTLHRKSRNLINRKPEFDLENMYTHRTLFLLVLVLSPFVRLFFCSAALRKAFRFLFIFTFRILPKMSYWSLNHFIHMLSHILLFSHYKMCASVNCEAIEHYIFGNRSNVMAFMYASVRIYSKRM